MAADEFEVAIDSDVGDDNKVDAAPNTTTTNTKPMVGLAVLLGAC